VNAPLSFELMLYLLSEARSTHTAKILLNRRSSATGVMAYRRTSISRKKKAQITFPLGHFLPLKVVKKTWKSQVK
jgi:hypothetical protein